MTREKKRSPPDISDLLLDEDGFYRYSDRPFSSLFNLLVVRNKMMKIKLLLLSIKHILRDQSLPVKYFHELWSTYIDPAVLSVGQQQPESLVSALNDTNADEAAPLTLGERDVFSSSIIGSSLIRTISSVLIHQIRYSDKILRNQQRRRKRKLISKNIR